jgi:hypothetical protein
MGLKNYLEVSLKNTFLFGFARSAYHFLVKVERKAYKLYTGFLESLLPAGYYVQRTPDYVNAAYPDFMSDARTYNSNCPENQKDGTRIITVKYLLEIVNKLPEGDYAELGTYRGAFAHLIFKYMDPRSSLYCFDTFEGFASQDVNIEMNKTGDQVRSGFFSDTSMEGVANTILGGAENRRDKLKLVKGYFPDTFAGYENKKWRFVLLDADLYQPQKSGMEKFWDNIVDGGVLMMHDYMGTYAGAHQASNEFFAARGIQVIPVADTSGSAFVIKQNSK